MFIVFLVKITRFYKNWSMFFSIKEENYSIIIIRHSHCLLLNILPDIIPILIEIIYTNREKIRMFTIIRK